MTEPLTEEQLAQIGRETKHAATKMLRCYTRRAVVGFAILFVGFGAGIWSDRHERSERIADSNAARTAIVDSGNAVAITGCNRDFIYAQRIQEILRLFSVPRGKHLFPLPDCRTVEHAVTESPTKQINVPKPLYAGSPNAPEPPKLNLRRERIAD